MNRINELEAAAIIEAAQEQLSSVQAEFTRNINAIIANLETAITKILSGGDSE